MAARLAFVGQPMVAGAAAGIALTSTEPLSFWGGVSPETGEVIDRRHPLSGTFLPGRILVLPGGRGSCSASGVLLEAIRNGTAPAAILLSRPDPILALGSILGAELDGLVVPVVLIDDETFASLKTGNHVSIEPSGRVVIQD